MLKNDIKYDMFIKTLREELIPAMGCTEPIAIAYAASKARDVLGELPDKVDVIVSKSIIKNVKSVIVPNTNGLKGIEVAVAAGIIGGDSKQTLNVISNITETQKKSIHDYIKRVPITVMPLMEDIMFDITIIVYSKKEHAKVHITEYHTNIICIEKNNKIVYAKDEKSHFIYDDCKRQNNNFHLDKYAMNIKDIIDFADSFDIEDLKELLDKQIDYNIAIAEEGLRSNYGANIGSTLLKAYGDNIRNRAIAKAAAGSDARMSGCEMPVIINAGSGNQGITVSVPIIEYAKELKVTQDKIYRALVVSNLIALHEKTSIGTLSAYCGAVSAGCAAGCGIAYLYGGSYREIAHTLVNSLAIVSGIICDGAKPSCAAKVAISIEAGILGYHMYRNGQEFKGGDGIVKSGVEETIQNVGQLGKVGMKETEEEILKIMLK